MANKQTPTGGVLNPIERAVTMNTTKWTGSTPTCNAVGMSTGVRSRIAAVISKNIPMIMKMNPINTIINAGLCEIPNIKVLTLSGN